MQLIAEGNGYKVYYSATYGDYQVFRDGAALGTTKNRDYAVGLTTATTELAQRVL